MHIISAPSAGLPPPTWPSTTGLPQKGPSGFQGPLSSLRETETLPSSCANVCLTPLSPASPLPDSAPQLAPPRKIFPVLCTVPSSDFSSQLQTVPQGSLDQWAQPLPRVLWLFWYPRPLSWNLQTPSAKEGMGRIPLPVPMEDGLACSLRASPFFLEAQTPSQRTGQEESHQPVDTPSKYR